MNATQFTAQQLYAMRLGITSLIEAEGNNYFQELADLEQLLTIQYQLAMGI